jgi:hypothetical protein
MLYRAGDKKGAEKLGMDVADDLESIINFFLNSDPDRAGRNIEDFSSAVSNYMSIYTIVNDRQFGDPNSKLTSRVNKMVDKLYGSELPKLYKALQEKAAENGESMRRGTDGYYTNYYFEVQGNMDGIGIERGVIEAPMPTAPQPTQPGAQLPNQEMVLPEESQPGPSDSVNG